MSDPYLPVKSSSEEWGTPAEIFDPLDEEFGFTLDAAASNDNALCEWYYTKEDDGTQQDWQDHTVWVNPPYNSGALSSFVQKAMREVMNGVTTVLLVPTKTDQAWFHALWDRFLEGKWRIEFRWVKGRVKFVGADNSAPFPVVIIVVGPK